MMSGMPHAAISVCRRSKTSPCAAQMASGPVKEEKREPLFKAVKLSPKDVADVKAFLESLTGESTYSAEPVLP